MTPKTRPSLLVSACLLGRACRYDGASRRHPGARAYVVERRSQGFDVVAVCPEESAEMGTPRPAIELRGGGGEDVLRGGAGVFVVETGEDVTAALTSGARAARQAAPEALEAVLKARSPSCGVGHTHIDGAVRAGDGVFAALLRSEGVALRTEADFEEG